MRREIQFVIGSLILISAGGCSAALAPSSGIGVSTPSPQPTTTLSTPAAATLPATLVVEPSPVGTQTRVWTIVAVPTALSDVVKETPVMNGVPIPTPLDPGIQSVVAQTKQDLARRLGVPVEQIELVQAESVTWPDAGLGCPRPGMAYAQVQVDGVRIQLRAGGRIYNYHGGGGRAPFLCENKG